MSEFKICRVCLLTEAKVFKFDEYQLKPYYEEVIALKVNENDGFPQYFCYECATMLHKFHKFKEKCYTGLKVLREMLWKGKITYESVYRIDRKTLNLSSPLEILDANKMAKIFATKETKILNEEDENIEERTNDIKDVKHELFVKLESFEDDDDDDEGEFSNNDPDYDPVDIDLEPSSAEFDVVNDTEDTTESLQGRKSSPTTIFVGANGTFDKKQKLKLRKQRHLKAENKLESKRARILKSNWKTFILSEEEALQAFRDKSQQQRYTSATYKCKDCFKTFSKEEMLKRHNKLRHSESNGRHECRFCKMRFKWDCYLRKHMREHYFRYQCLRCDLVCPLEMTALLHEEYHNGKIRKCPYCDEEFKHASTYYTHLRTHRSAHVCTLCGISFVSEGGLRQHKRIKHCMNDEDSPDDDEDVNTFCASCDIRFETRKAYEEHVYHSTKHVADNDDNDNNKKWVLRRKRQDKNSNKTDSRRSDTFPIKVEKRRFKRSRKPQKKPTTCHQCGEHFDTQQACLKHHLADHPRTSFFPPNVRHICEICGASLAPGSIATHQNMHTREKLHPCNTCGKQFHSQAGLKRHIVAHTGEKPFPCSLCEKRFTQSNSMKLHFRTFHLKEPYPKRNRRKKKEEPQENTGAESCEESNENSAGSERGRKRIKPVTQIQNDNTALHVLENTDMQYLTIGY